MKDSFGMIPQKRVINLSPWQIVLFLVKMDNAYVAIQLTLSRMVNVLVQQLVFLNADVWSIIYV